MSTFFTVMPTPVGDLTVTGDGEAVTGLAFGAPPAGAVRDDERLVAARTQLGEYFAGERTAFDLPLRPAGTPFERRVWRELEQVGFGETASYGEIARRIGHPDAARAVGRANGRNPIAIVVPCHRVIGAAGALTGYAGGLERKRRLLDHEARLGGLERQPSLLDHDGRVDGLEPSLVDHEARVGSP